jgi:hypothetical protein
MMPTYDELLKENALLRLEIAEAMRILRGGSTLTGEGREIYTSLVERAGNIVDILQAEMSHVDDLEKELGISKPENDSRQLDLFESEENVKCVDCGNNLTLVHPGKHQCEYCEGQYICRDLPMCNQNCYPTHAATCNTCPLKRKYG